MQGHKISLFWGNYRFYPKISQKALTCLKSPFTDSLVLFTS
ncbi:hypothetical protein MYAER_2166 [Microcystis aeruginosa NIES-2549]|uniref:Uncharacterized protein n=1 Tax=Microcystis aeruginosa NIES-2549 TaxID=1641812 RepID=A0A0F6U3U6_MICAE|nr:hypothetical protein MYAER_2166 [Microcystis aeruginosa NIES-2549]AOC52912.1 hypothetical protein amyaer_2193 [Microcystis aeruginosa NIES-2481]